MITGCLFNFGQGNLNLPVHVQFTLIHSLSSLKSDAVVQVGIVK